MSRFENHTPRQIVMSVLIRDIAGLYNEAKNHSSIDDEGLSPVQRRDVLRHLALQHNSLLAGSGLDGIELEIPPKETAPESELLTAAEERAVEREALPYAMSKASRYSVEQQQDGTYAVFNGGGFVKGGFPSHDRTAALHYARDLADADEQSGVPVMERAD